MHNIVTILTFHQQPDKVFSVRFVSNQIPMQKLKFYKTILEKVSFSNSLYAREYRKAMRHLSDDQRAVLERWSTRYYKHPTSSFILLEED